MKAGTAERERLEREIDALVEQLIGMGARKIFLFGSLARGQLSLFSDIDLLVLFDGEQPARDLTREVYRCLRASEAVDVLAYSLRSWERIKDRPFFRHILSYARVLYERPEAGSEPVAPPG
jgi:predicted nucleotidyltransferase